MMNLQRRMNKTEDQQKMDYMRFKDHTSRSTTNYEYKYPQVGKTGVDAVHEKLSTDGLFH